MAARDSNGHLTAAGMAQVVAAGGSVLWQNVSITDPALLPTQSQIDSFLSNDPSSPLLRSDTNLLRTLGDQMDLLHKRI